MIRPPPSPQPPRAVLRAYRHLAERGRVPSDYEVATTGLLYMVGRGLEVEVPLAAEIARCGAGSPLRADWERFVDPRATTYARYTALQARQEAYVERVLERIESTGYDQSLPPPTTRWLASVVSPLRYPFHGLQMLAAQIGQVAPGGRLVVVAALTAGDQLRRVQRVAQRTAQLRRRDPAFGDDARAIWQGDAAWQPLRSCLERLLVTLDWGEAFTGTCLCLAPLLDHLVLGVLANEARARGDDRLGEIFASLEDDGRWHRDWARALVRTAVEQEPGNRQVMEGWIGRWLPPAVDAVVSLGRSALVSIAPAGPSLDERAAAFFESLDLGPAPDALRELRAWR